MTYVMSDIHGEYEKYLKMLDLIGFRDEDELYVLGDVIDRGPEPVQMLKDMSYRPNVYPILGNHEAVALSVLKPLMTEITDKNYSTQINAQTLKLVSYWQMDGGDVTLQQFRRLPPEERFALIEYMEEFEPYAVVECKDVTYILVHAGLGNYAPDKRLSEYTADELTMMRPEEETWYYDRDIRVVIGHTPTLAVTERAEIHRYENVIMIDCGATFGGRLACLCLETGEEFYV